MIPAEFASRFFVVAVGLIALGLWTFSLSSFCEREKRCARRAAGLALASTLALLVSLFLLRSFLSALGCVVFALSVVLVLLLFLPIGNIRFGIQVPKHRVDERDIPFARVLLRPGTPEYDSYYALRPENKEVDDRLRELPELLSPDAKLADPLAFAAAGASFDFIEFFRDRVEVAANSRRHQFPPETITDKIKALARFYGARGVGVARLQEYHVYSHIGRGTGRYGAEIELPHQFAIAFTVEMSHQLTRSGPLPPVVMESSHQYVEAARVAMQLMRLIGKLGYSARAHIDSNYRVIAPLVARDAGLGEIGRMGLLMTPDLGPRVRLGVVTTDLPLVPDDYTPDPTVIDFCRVCTKCAENCPTKAIPGGDCSEVNGALRWQIDAMKCFKFWNIAGTDCARCVAVCPYSHPDTLLHRGVRTAVKHSGFARRVAVWMDDLFYGRQPEQFPAPKWCTG